MMILQSECIYTYEDLYAKEINETYIRNWFCDTLTTLDTMVKLGIYKNRQSCRRCNSAMSFVKCKTTSDGYRWCCRRPCRATASIRLGSYFCDLKIPLQSLITIFYKYINGTLPDDIAHEVLLNRHTVGSWCSFARQIIIEDLCNNNELIGGVNTDGSAKVVEIDESLFFKRKYNRGRFTNGQWYVGGVERGSRRCFIVPVENRNAQTMMNVIQDNVLPGTIIITDEWRAYSRAMEDLTQYTHHTINHSLYFVDPVNPNINTQRIENFWSGSKAFLREKRGICQEEHHEYLLQYIWQRRIEKRKRINAFMYLLRQ